MKLLGTLGVGLLMALGFLLVRDPGYIPPFDANRTQLVDSQAGAVCAAKILPKVGLVGAPDYTLMEDCLEAAVESTEPDLAVVIPTWCMQFVADGWPGEVADCEAIFNRDQYWPNMRGGLSQMWNRTFPWPGSTMGSNLPARAEDRDQTERKELTDARS